MLRPFSTHSLGRSLPQATSDWFCTCNVLSFRGSAVIRRKDGATKLHYRPTGCGCLMAPLPLPLLHIMLESWFCHAVGQHDAFAHALMDLRSVWKTVSAMAQILKFSQCQMMTGSLIVVLFCKNVLAKVFWTFLAMSFQESQLAYLCPKKNHNTSKHRGVNVNSPNAPHKQLPLVAAGCFGSGATKNAWTLPRDRLSKEIW